MAQRNGGRIDRFAQMNLQEQLIAKKRQEILEKQRTAQLAKAVAAAQNLSAKKKNEATVEAEEQEQEASPKKEEDVPESSSKSNSTIVGKSKSTFAAKRAAAPVPVAEQPPPKVQNFFCNDGSFLDHFKKILEKHDQPKPPVIVETAATQAAAAAAAAAANNAENNVVSNETEQNVQPNAQQSFPLPPPPPQPPFAFDASNLVPQANPGLPQQQHSQAPQQLQPPPMVGYSPTQQQPGAPPLQQQSAPAFFTPVQHHIPPPPPPTAVTGVPLMGIPSVTTAPPPPPPPPQLPLALANMAQLYMIPAPEPLQLNAIPAPKELDLNAIPKPQLNLEAIQVPADQQQLQMNQQNQQQFQQQQQMQMQQQQLQQNQMQSHQMHHNQPDRNQQDNNDQCIQIPTTVETLIALVAEYGDDYEDKICSRKNDLHPTMWFLFDKSSEQYHNYRQRLNERRRCNQQHQQQQHQQLQQIDEPGTSTQKMLPSDCDKYDPESVISGDVDSDDEYMRGMMDRNRDNIKRRIECRNELSEEERQEEERQRQEKKKMRKSRWGEKIEIPEDSLSSPSSGVLTTFANQNKPLLSTVTRSDPQLLQYARLNYGSTNLSEEDWRKCEEHFKVNLLYQDMMRKRQEIDRLARNGKFKYEYDSDEDVDGGTWEHKLRCAEMEATQAWAQALTKQSEGKHHIGDFLPPEELKKFMEQYEAKKNDRQPDLSDYKEYKLKEDNIGFQMLQKLGWKEGQGLGSGGAGIIDPVNKAPQREGNQGLGVASASTPENCDNEYDAYRKRMMLAYRFRPNPLNNPRRAYY